MKKRWTIILTLFFLGIMIVGTSAQEIKWQPAPKTIDVGVIAELTGLTALMGEVERAACEIALDNVNKEGGINGIPMRILYEDCKGTNPGAVAAVNKAIYDQKVYAVFVTSRSTIAHALHPLISQAEIPTMYGGSAWSVRELQNPWMFGLRTNDSNVSKIMAKVIVERLGHKKIAGLYSDEAFGQGGTTETVKWLKELYGIEPVALQRHARGTKDYTAQLLTIKESGATCLFGWSANCEDIGIFLRQIKQLDLDVDVIGPNAFGNQDITLKIAGKDAEGIYVILDYSPQNPSPVVQNYVKAMEERFNLPGGGGTNWTYDGVLILADAMQRAGIVREIDGKKMIMPLEQARDAIRVALGQTKDFGPEQGSISTYTCDKFNDLAHSQVLAIIENGQHKILESVELEIAE